MQNRESTELSFPQQGHLFFREAPHFLQKEESGGLTSPQEQTIPSSFSFQPSFIAEAIDRIPGDISSPASLKTGTLSFFSYSVISLLYPIIRNCAPTPVRGRPIKPQKKNFGGSKLHIEEKRLTNPITVRTIPTGRQIQPIVLKSFFLFS